MNKDQGETISQDEHLKAKIEEELFDRVDTNSDDTIPVAKWAENGYSLYEAEWMDSLTTADD